MSDESAMPDDDPADADVIGDIEPDDEVTDGDEEVDWSQVEVVQMQIDDINEIDDDAERGAAAEQWALELGGEG